MPSPIVTPSKDDRIVFFITEADVAGMLDSLSIENLGTGTMVNLLHFVGDRFDNRVVEDLADAVIDFFAYQEEN